MWADFKYEIMGFINKVKGTSSEQDAQKNSIDCLILRDVIPLIMPRSD